MSVKQHILAENALLSMLFKRKCNAECDFKIYYFLYSLVISTKTMSN